MRVGFAVHIYRASRSMKGRYFWADGEPRSCAQARC
jgi:hypothetical protein